VTAKFNDNCDYFGGAVLADSTCGIVTLSTASGATFTFKLNDDPEFVMSGLSEPCMLSERW
jgi:hypothetical protein